ncbi:MAG: DUF433 domain-containing protein [Gammaproteobacteria bacterium]
MTPRFIVVSGYDSEPNLFPTTDPDPTKTTSDETFPWRIKKRRPNMTMNYQPFISCDPKVCGGQAVVRGTRVTVRTVLASLAEGMSVEEILKDFPTLEEQAVRAVIAFAAVSAEEDLPIPPAPTLV